MKYRTAYFNLSQILYLHSHFAISFRFYPTSYNIGTAFEIYYLFILKSVHIKKLLVAMKPGSTINEGFLLIYYVVYE